MMNGSKNKYQPNNTSTDVNFFAEINQGQEVTLAGRVINFRQLGNICFGKLVDHDGEVQFALKKDVAPDAYSYRTWKKSVKIGSIIYLRGEFWISSTGEHTALVTDELKILRESLHPFPNKVTGITDPEQKLRKRYLDTTLNLNTARIFTARSSVIKAIRNTLEEHRFLEVETPILQTIPGGANAKPFITQHNASGGKPMYLRVAPETYLKRAVAGSFDRVFEIGKNFRNEGTDPSHLQEFTTVEWYAAYWNYMDNLELFYRMLVEIYITAALEGKNNNVAMLLNPDDHREEYYSDVFKHYVGYLPREASSVHQIESEFKSKVLPNLVHPTILIDYPASLSPLAERNPDGETVAQWQLIANGWELVKCYNELTDPVLQRKLLQEQAKARSDGDEEAMMIDEDFLECMEYGMPPMSGLGIGIDRFVALLTDQSSLRNTVLFPTVW